MILLPKLRGCRSANRRSRKPDEVPRRTGKPGDDSAANDEIIQPTQNQDLGRRLALEIASIHLHIQEIRAVLAKSMGISSPQWAILMALMDLDRGGGLPIKTVSKILNVDPSFVTTQSKLLEKKGLLHRRTSTEDGRVVRLSVTDKTLGLLDELSPKRGRLKEIILAEFTELELEELNSKLAAMRDLLARANQDFLEI